MKELGFSQSKNDQCIYVYHLDATLIVAVYVDDIIIAGDSEAAIERFINDIGKRFKVKDMGKLHYFLGVKVVYVDGGKILLSQPTYTREILRRFGMENSKSIATPVDQGLRLMKATKNDQSVNQELYQSAVGKSSVSIH